MTSENAITLSRDVAAVQIPNGNKVTLPRGSGVILTQSLGGSFTVHVPSLAGLYRIDGADADALGQAPPVADEVTAHAALDERIWAALKTCYDPEIPVNIVDLGLIYSMNVGEAADGKAKVNVKMTLTAPGCGMGPSIAADAKNKILAIGEVSDADVEVVWEPQWNPGMITKEGKARLGIPE